MARTLEQIAADERAANPSYTIGRSRRDADGKRVHEEVSLTPEETPAAYEATVADRAQLQGEQERQRDAEAQEQTRRERAAALLAAIENGTAGEALAALRVVVPWLVRRELR